MSRMGADALDTPWIDKRGCPNSALLTNSGVLMAAMQAGSGVQPAHHKGKTQGHLTSPGLFLYCLFCNGIPLLSLGFGAISGGLRF